MKIKMILAIVGMGIALTACASEAETTESVPVEQGSITETVVEAQSETESRTEESKPEEAESETDAQAEPEKASEKETESEKVSEKETASREVSEATQETDKAEAVAAEEEAPQAKGSFTQADIAVSVRGVTVAPGEIMENYVNALGEPDAYEASPSCVEVGDDKIYTYGGVTIYSCRSNGTDRINLIEIKGAETMAKGIQIGDTADAVIAAYGDSYTMDGNEMVYEINDRVMGFLITDGKVSFMELFAR